MESFMFIRANGSIFGAVLILPNSFRIQWREDEWGSGWEKAGERECRKKSNLISSSSPDHQSRVLELCPLAFLWRHRQHSKDLNIQIKVPYMIICLEQDVASALLRPLPRFQKCKPILWHETSAASLLNWFFASKPRPLLPFHKAVLDTENMYLRHRDRYSVLYLRHILKSTLYDCIFDTFDRADTNT